LLRKGQLESPILPYAKTRAALQMTLQARDALGNP
jgi:hypothetical protein